jgi:hypothetical protein
MVRGFQALGGYASINHMGFVVLGIAAAAWAVGSEHAVLALNGAVLQMFSHGLSAAGMFFLVGVIYERTHTRNLNAYGGLFPLVPVYGGILIFTAMSWLGLPGTGRLCVRISRGPRRLAGLHPGDCFEHDRTLLYRGICLEGISCRFCMDLNEPAVGGYLD